MSLDAESLAIAKTNHTAVGLWRLVLGALLLADEVGKLVGVAHPENGRVVADQVPVAFLGINLDCETPKVALGVGRSALPGDVRETHETLALRAPLQGLGLGVAADIASNLERTVSAGALGMDDALGNALAVEIGVLLEQLPVLDQQRSARAGGQRVLIVCNRCAALSGQLFWLIHLRTPYQSAFGFP
jgi:hypothetical protein